MNLESLRILVEMTKPRLSSLALVMTALGFYLGIPKGEAFSQHLFTFVWALFGAWLLSAAAAILNQCLEEEIDGLMNRTRSRPLPSGRINSRLAGKVGIVLGIVGIFELLLTTNPMTAVLGALTLLFYLGVYTSSKRVSVLSTWVGAIPGALPPLMGWTAARGVLGWPGVILFLIVFLWQIPHFLAIGWLYREDYKRAHLPILPVVDPTGKRAAQQSLVFVVGLILVTLIPFAVGMAGQLYFWGALLLGLVFLGTVLQMVRRQTDQQARNVFRASLLYLPLLSLFLILDTL